MLYYYHLEFWKKGWQQCLFKPVKGENTLWRWKAELSGYQICVNVLFTVNSAQNYLILTPFPFNSLESKFLAYAEESWYCKSFKLRMYEMWQNCILKLNSNINNRMGRVTGWFWGQIISFKVSYSTNIYFPCRKVVIASSFMSCLDEFLYSIKCSIFSASVDSQYSRILATKEHHWILWQSRKIGCWVEFSLLD